MNTKTLEDLEFPMVLSHLSDLCLTELGKKYALRIKPFDNQESLLLALNQTILIPFSFSFMYIL